MAPLVTAIKSMISYNKGLQHLVPLPLTKSIKSFFPFYVKSHVNSIAMYVILKLTLTMMYLSLENFPYIFYTTNTVLYALLESVADMLNN